MRLDLIRAAIFLGAVSLFTTQVAANDIPLPEKLSWEGFRGGIFRTGDLYISGQPLSTDAMQALARAGISTIVNLRTPEEMTNRESTPVDEPATSRQLQLAYHHLPSGGPDYPYSPQTVKQFADILSASDGKVLLHCNSGRRAAHLWVAYLIEHRQLEIHEALKLGRSINFGSVPLEGYLGESESIQHLVRPATKSH